MINEFVNPNVQPPNQNGDDESWRKEFQQWSAGMKDYVRNKCLQDGMTDEEFRTAYGEFAIGFVNKFIK